MENSSSAQLTSDNSPATPPANGPNPRAVLKLALGAIGLGLGVTLLRAVVQVAGAVDTRAIYLGLDGLRRPLFGLLMFLCLSAAAVMYFRPRRRVIVGGLVGCLALVMVGRQLFRIESFYGNMVPRVTWRWSPRAEDAFANYHPTVTVATVANEELSTPRTRPSEWDFPGFLGPQRNGVIEGVSLADDWQTRAPVVRWRHPVGIGWGGFAVSGNYAVTQEQRGDQETTVCYDLVTGQERWAHGDRARFNDEHGDGPRATPTIDQQRVYALGADGLLTCLNLQDGTVQWQTALLSDPAKQNLLWGMSGSPLVVDDLVIATPGGAAGRAIVAFRADDGTPAFAHGDDPAAYASPTLLPTQGERQLLSFNGAGLRGYHANGEPAWLFPWITQGEKQRVNVAQPIVVRDAQLNAQHAYVLVSSGYSMGISLVEVSGEGQSYSAREVWHATTIKSKMSNFIYHNGYVYGLDNGILTCLSIVDGQQQWKKGRYGHGQLLCADNKLLVQAESGDLALVAADPHGYRELSTFPALADKTWNHGALSGNVYLIRNDREAVCVELPTAE